MDLQIAQALVGFGIGVAKVLRNFAIYPHVGIGLLGKEEATAIVATWQFDRPGAIVPEPIGLAPIGGYAFGVDGAEFLKENVDVRRAIDERVRKELGLAREPEVVGV